MTEDFSLGKVAFEAYKRECESHLDYLQTDFENLNIWARRAWQRAAEAAALARAGGEGKGHGGEAVGGAFGALNGLRSAVEALRDTPLRNIGDLVVATERVAAHFERLGPVVARIEAERDAALARAEAAERLLAGAEAALREREAELEEAEAKLPAPPVPRKHA